MLASLFDYHLPPQLIAQEPAGKRDQSRLMAINRDSKKHRHLTFKDLPQLLAPVDLLVLNDTRVISGRLYGKKSTGARIEITLIGGADENDRTWRCLAKPAKRLKPGTKVQVDDDLTVRFISRQEGPVWLVEIESKASVFTALERAGHAPLPPYIRRKEVGPREADIGRYQTVYARDPGAVAAPTAGLHFTAELLDELKRRGVSVATVTLHVGWGSFAPIREEKVEDHKVESEFFRVSEDAARSVKETKLAGGRVVAVGTTSVRALESAYRDGEVKSMEGSADLFILPGYKFRVVDALLTNFHLPQSSLIMLAAAFAGREFILDAYREAIKMEYRFYSYGDAMLIC